MSKLKPLLAEKADMDLVRYPVLASPKLDGIRCMMVNGVAMSRSMKPIPNLYVQEQLEGLHGMDGELMVRGDYNAVQSAIMKRTGQPEFQYWVFDHFLAPSKPYRERMEDIACWEEVEWHDRIHVLKSGLIYEDQELMQYMDSCLELGYEGVMIRDPDGPYKFGRSTVKQGTLLKLKRFLDDEATLVEFTEKMHNTNELEKNELGYAKRSSAKENLVPAGTAGSVILNWNGLEFRAGFGPGITDAIKQEWWDNRHDLQAHTVKFSYQELSKDGVPRFGKMLGFRHLDDM